MPSRVSRSDYCWINTGLFVPVETIISPYTFCLSANDHLGNLLKRRFQQFPFFAVSSSKVKINERIPTAIERTVSTDYKGYQPDAVSS